MSTTVLFAVPVVQYSSFIIQKVTGPLSFYINSIVHMSKN